MECDSMNRMNRADWRAYATLKASGASPEQLAAYKRMLRKIRSRQAPPEPEYKWSVVHVDNYDSMILKTFIPHHFTVEDKYVFSDRYSYYYSPSPYDCTGQRFTISMDFYEVPEGTWVYHHVGIDI